MQGIWQSGVYDAFAEKLIAAGHRHIAFVGGPDKLMSVRERYQGFCTAMEQAGLSWPPEWVMYGDYQREFGQQVQAAAQDRTII